MSIDVTPRGTRTLTEVVAEEIRVALARRRMRQSQLARRMEVTEQWLSVRLRGVQPIDLNDLQRMAAALEVEVTDLIPTVTSPVRPFRDGTTEFPSAPPAPHSRPTDRRPSGHPRAGRPPAGPGRTGRVQRPIAA